MKRTKPRQLVIPKGRKVLIENVLMYNKHLKDKVQSLSDEELLGHAHPSDRVELAKGIGIEMKEI